MEIGRNNFSSKKDAILFYKSILNSYKTKEILNENDKEELIELLKIHPKVEEKFKSRILNIVIGTTKYNTKSFVLVYENDETEVFSYLKCINGEKNPLTKFRNTCRDLIQDDINKVKYQYFKENSKNGYVKCQETGELSKWDDLVVDHRQPNTFSIIVDRFIELNQILIDKIEYIEVIDGVYNFIDETLNEKFKEYHKDKAVLRIVRKNINFKRAYQARIKKSGKDLKIQ